MLPIVPIWLSQVQGTEQSDATCDIALPHFLSNINDTQKNVSKAQVRQERLPDQHGHLSLFSVVLGCMG